MIKILNVITSGLRREGITMTQLEFMKKFDMSGIQMTMAAVHIDDPGIIRDFETLGIRVVKFPDRNKNIREYCRSLYKHIKQEQYDIIHVHGSSAILATELMVAKLAGVKVRIAHSRNTTCKHEHLDKLLRPLFDMSYTDAFACGREAGEWLFGKKPFTIIHNGKDLDRFRFSPDMRKTVRDQYKIEDKLAIGTVGSMNNAKNHLFLIDIFKLVHDRKPETVLFIMGDGQKREQIEEKIRNYGLEDSVVLTGRISNVPDMLQGMDIMLLPSLYEGLPNVVLEWQIAGLPSYVSDTVTDECAVTELVEYLPIDKGPEIWADKVLDTDISKDRAAVSAAACGRMREEKFEINEGAKFVKEKYIELGRG